jgi:hypothetical protein
MIDDEGDESEVAMGLRRIMKMSQILKRRR